MNSHSDDMFILSSQVDYNRTAMGGYNSHYSVYQQQPERRLYFTDELLDDNKPENSLSNEPNTNATLYGNATTLVMNRLTQLLYIYIYIQGKSPPYYREPLPFHLLHLQKQAHQLLLLPMNVDKA